MMSGCEKIRVAVLGVGYLGRFHAQKYHSLPEAELVAVCDVVSERAEEIAGQNGCLAVSDYHDILEKVDAVSIVVPTIYHYQVAKECLEANLDILLEKPITRTLKEADELVELAKKRNRIFMAGHLERFNPAIVKLAASKPRPVYIEVQRLGPFKQRVSDTDVIRDLMIHDLDIILGFVEAPIHSISGVGVPILSDKVDLANARIEFENGCVANLTASRVSLGEGVRKIRIFQHENYISIDYNKQSMAVFTLREDNGSDPMSRIQINQVKLDPADALSEEIKSFLHCVKTRSQPVISGEDGRRALAAAIRVTEAVSKTPGPEDL